MNYLIIILISFSYLSAESITIYAEESAEYFASGSGSSGCCSASVLGSYNQNTHYTDWCQWWSQYGQCGSRSRYALWRFDLSEVPENANIVNASFLAQGGGNWIQSFMSISDYVGSISLGMASYLASGGDWVLQGQGQITTPVNQTIPNNNIISAYNTGQLSVMFHMYDASITNVGVNAPRVIIEYELLEYECSEMNEFECSDGGDCEWVEDIEYGDCSNYSNGSTCDANENCYWDLCYGGSYGSWSHCCRGGTYQIDNSYCMEIEDLECSEMNQLQCFQDSSCEWISDIEIASCGSLTGSDCELALGCDWECWSDPTGYIPGCTYSCTGGTYELNNSYCQEVSFLPGDANGDGSLNISDIVLIVDLILSSDYDQNSDINQDGMLNISDIIEIINNILT